MDDDAWAKVGHAGHQSEQRLCGRICEGLAFGLQIDVCIQAETEESQCLTQHLTVLTGEHKDWLAPLTLLEFEHERATFTVSGRVPATTMTLVRLIR